MDNNDKVLEALEEFGRDPSPTEIPPVLGRYLETIASTGETLFPWSSVKPLFAQKLDEAMKKFHSDVPTDHLAPCPNVENLSFDAMRQRLLDILDSFPGTPFTIQRLCELITQPTKHYKRTDKFLRGIEKNMLVVSAVDIRGNKIVYESKPMVNGMSSNGLESVHGTPIKSFLTPPAPANSPVTTSTWYNTTTESWAQGGGDAPTTSEVTPPSPLARQPIRAEGEATTTTPSSSPTVGADESKTTAAAATTTTESEHEQTESEQTVEAAEMGKTAEEKPAAEGKDEKKTVTETKAAADSTDKDADNGENADTDTKPETDTDSGEVNTTEKSTEAGELTDTADVKPHGADAEKSCSETAGKKEPASSSTSSTTTSTDDNTESESETDDVTRRDSGDSGGFETSDDVSDIDLPESSTGPDAGPVPDDHQHQQSGEAAESSEVLTSSSTQPESEESSKRSQPDDDDNIDFPDQSPCKKLKLDRDVSENTEAECLNKTQVKTDGDREEGKQQECEKTQTSEEDDAVGDSACSSSTPEPLTVSGDQVEECKSDTDKQIDDTTPDSQSESTTSTETCTPCGIDTSCTPDDADTCTPSSCVDMQCTPSDGDVGPAGGATTDDNSAVSSTQVAPPATHVVPPAECEDNRDEVNTSTQSGDEPMEVDS